jgi:hypothetical protein
MADADDGPEAAVAGREGEGIGNDGGKEEGEVEWERAGADFGEEAQDRGADDTE